MNIVFRSHIFTVLKQGYLEQSRSNLIVIGPTGFNCRIIIIQDIAYSRQGFQKTEKKTQILISGHPYEKKHLVITSMSYRRRVSWLTRNSEVSGSPGFTVSLRSATAQ